MGSKIELSIINGELRDTKFGIDERMTCIIGRDNDCNMKIPSNVDGSISRHHCILDINPPEIIIRDLGSSNGTFVNDINIVTPENDIAGGGTVKINSDHVLNHGDRLQVGDTFILVGINLPAKCQDCDKEIPPTELDTHRRNSGLYQCDDCYKQSLNSDLLPFKFKALTTNGGFQPTEEGNTSDAQPAAEEHAGDTSIILGNIRSETVPIDLTAKTLHIYGYRLIRQLGRGGMGAVYLAEEEKTKQEIALKIMLPKTSVSQHSLDDFLREMDNTQALNHTNIVKVLDSGYSHGSFYFGMEYCNEGDLFDLMKKRGGTLRLEEAAGIIMQVLDGLEYAHNAEIPYVKLKTGSVQKGNGLIHRDVKSENIYIVSKGDRGVAKIADFGLAKAFDLAGMSGCTRTGDAAGTPFFMSRSQLIDFKYAKPDIDVWASAATLYFMLTKEFPRDFSGGVDPLKQILETQPIPIQQRNPAVPDKLAKVIDYALIDGDQLNFKTALQLKTALKEALD